MTCRRCDNDGYLDESTQSIPVYCDCPVGVAAEAMDDYPSNNVKLIAYQEARRSTR